MTPNSDLSYAWLSMESVSTPHTQPLTLFLGEWLTGYATW